MIAAIIIILVCVILMGYITIRTIEEKRINNMRENTKKSKKGKK